MKKIEWLWVILVVMVDAFVVGFGTSKVVELYTEKPLIDLELTIKDTPIKPTDDDANTNEPLDDKEPETIPENEEANKRLCVTWETISYGKKAYKEADLRELKQVIYNDIQNDKNSHLEIELMDNYAEAQVYMCVKRLLKDIASETDKLTFVETMQTE